MKNLLKTIIILFLGISLWQGCATTQRQKSQADYKRDIVELQSKLKANPKDSESLREIGVICYEIKYNRAALKYLLRSFKYNLNDPKTNAYLGLALEAENKDKLATRVYQRYIKFPLDSIYRTIMEGRLNILARAMVRQEMRERIELAGSIDDSELSPGSVAVFPLTYGGKNPQYASLGRGISEMMITDLSQVPDMKIIERIQIQALIDEMNLGNSGMVAEGSAPQFGHLLSAGKIVHGSYHVQSRNQLQLKLAFWDILEKRFPEFGEKNDVLQNLFKLEKDIVFSLINDMGITLTPTQREKILRVPTKDINAFITYCLGLEKEDAGDYFSAAKYFQKASQLDPSFTLATARARSNQAMSFSASILENRTTEFTGPPPQPAVPVSSQDDLIRDRLQQLSLNIGTNFVPGQETRKSAEEAQTAGSEFLQELPLPPSPPIRP